MKKLLVYLTFTFVLALSLEAQTENSAPIAWERYKISDQRLSVLLPKMPTVTENSDICKEEQRSVYYAYAAGVVYEMTVVSRSKNAFRPGWCTASRTAFDLPAIERRMDEIREFRDKPVASNVNVGGVDVYRFTAERSTRQVIPDVANKRWIELAMTYYPGSKPDLEQFLGSLQTSEVGIEIGAGAKWTLGDPPTANLIMDLPPDIPSADRKPGPAPVSPGTVSFIIVAKPRAGYTEAARRAGTQGSVRLKVPLLANGSVGTPAVLIGLDHGLTEQAIDAAQRLVFLPKKVNDVPVSSRITIEYTFSIY